MTLAVGTILKERYRIDELLGQGGFGAVYRAWDLNLEIPVALKENREVTPAAQQQFRRETKILLGLKHDNLPRVYDTFSLPRRGQYLVMEYVEGRDLEQVLKEAGGRLNEAQALRWLDQVLGALEYLHNQQPPVIHRDIKPANIRITPKGQAMLVDFGIAKVFNPESRTTGVAQAISPGYSPFEQYGQAPTDARSDLYALGATLYRLLGGQVPPDSPARVGGAALEPLRALHPAVSPGVEAAVQRALEMQPASRFQTAAELRRALKQAAAPAPVAPRDAATPPASPWQHVPTERPKPVEPTQQVPPAAASPARTEQIPLPAPEAAAPALNRRSWLPWLGGGLAVVVGYFLLQALIGPPPVVATSTVEPATVEATTAEPVNFTATWQAGLTQTSAAEGGIAAAQTQAVQTVLAGTQIAQRAATQTQVAGLTQTASAVPEGMVLIPAGDFRMGSTEADSQADSDEKPQHTVFLDAFYIDLSEVTNRLYAECVQAGVCTPPQQTKSYTRSSYYNDPQYADYPVIYVDWNQAQAYCQWRGGDLPTEAQWEKAARGEDGRIYPWGNSFDGSKVNFCDTNCPFSHADKSSDDGYTDTSPVGSYPDGRSPYGVFDLAGNVWEWVLDWYQADYYSSRSSWENPFGPSSGEYRVLRGGAWYSSDISVRSAYRDWYALSSIDVNVGFRCARSK